MFRKQYTLIIIILTIALTPITARALSIDDIRTHITQLLHTVMQLHAQLLSLTPYSSSDEFAPMYTETNTGYIVEEEVFSSEDCTQFETYNPENATCFFTCTSLKDCKEREAKISEEISQFDDWSAQYHEFTQNFEEFDGDMEEFYRNEIIEIIYTVTEGEKLVIDKGVENTQHTQVKTWFKAISPDDFSDTYIARLIIYKTGENGDATTAAFVTENPHSPDRYDMYINLDTFLDGEKEMIFTLIHEFAHIITLNADQIDHTVYTQYTCTHFYTDEGCARKSSYIHNFYTTFWKDAPYANEELQPENRYTAYPHAFVSEYAASNTGEDIAESFASFVFTERRHNGRIADKKIAFFYQYPELVAIRTHIRAELPLVAPNRISP